MCTAHTARPQQGCPAVFVPVIAGRYTAEVNSIRSERARAGIHMHIYEAICSYICVCVRERECNTYFPDTYLYIYLGVYTHSYVCMYVCMYVYTHI